MYIEHVWPRGPALQKMCMRLQISTKDYYQRLQGVTQKYRDYCCYIIRPLLYTVYPFILEDLNFHEVVFQKLFTKQFSRQAIGRAWLVAWSGLEEWLESSHFINTRYWIEVKKGQVLTVSSSKVVLVTRSVDEKSLRNSYEAANQVRVIVIVALEIMWL